jgi:hypothetical protein
MAETYQDTLRRILTTEAARAMAAYDAGRRRQAIQIARKAIAAADAAYTRYPLHTLNSSGLTILTQLAELGGK